ncbi:fumarylacetoacetate hydrolase-like protein [Clathrospora elynae]|uniref:Fumarylacetoacetate hydrolase-like protein n=1 Tax=Clathrospora elynae TaxID=706981 RepID=A0A6A5SJA0_9PLEO|nr:fumarylacetoacetate hydrolase-like protein [Clathrospora elynae]
MTATYSGSLTNYVAYQDAQSRRNRIGHYDLPKNTIQPLSFISGTPIDSLYQVIEVGEANIIPFGDHFPASLAKILAPLTNRDVLCVGKNYAEHAKEFNSSGFDSSDKIDTPSHPVIFTKRYTSIIADGEEILPHPDFTRTVDYEGEIGVIIGKTGFRIKEEDAMSHVWGYTIINDVTARERQRDHKQFYIGKSADTFCPMGPIAVPASHVDQVLRVRTHVNGELRQNATTDDLIFSIPYLIKTMSEGQTLMPGDVLATGTPAGVGIGRKPPVYLKPGDIIAVSVTGLGTLTNRVADLSTPNPITGQVASISNIHPNNAGKSPNGSALTKINNKPLYYKTLGKGREPPIVFVHGLGGNTESFTPLIQTLSLEKSHSLHLFDLEGHGLSPTSPLSKLNIESFAEDLNSVLEHASLTSSVTLIAHDMGCLIAAHSALAHPDKVSKLILIGPPPSPLLEADIAALNARAETVRREGMVSIVDTVTAVGTSEKTKTWNYLAIAAIRILLLSQDAEGYAKACTALAGAKDLDFGAIQAHTLIITGSEDEASSPQLCEEYGNAIGEKASLKVLDGCGHWHVFEDLQGVAQAVQEFLR